MSSSPSSPEPSGARERDEGTDTAQVQQELREAVADGDMPSAPPTSGGHEDEAAYGTEHEQGAAQPGPG